MYEAAGATGSRRTCKQGSLKCVALSQFGAMSLLSWCKFLLGLVLRWQVMLSYTGPLHGHRLVCTSSGMASAEGKRCMQSGSLEAFLVVAAITGTDYNPKGLAAFGDSKARIVVGAFLKLWRSLGHAGDKGILEFICQQLHQDADNCALLKQNTSSTIRLFLKNARQHVSCFSPAGTFADEVKHVAGVFHSQMNLAQSAACKMTRRDAEWTGDRLLHGDIIRALEEAGLNHQQQNGCDAVLSKVAALEAERMVRYGEEHTDKALLGIQRICKARQWYQGKANLVAVRIWPSCMCKLQR